MRFGQLVIHNFFRVKHLVIDLSQIGLTLIEGVNYDVGKSNEAGKSTIFMALCWCLYGRFPGGPAKPGDEIVNPLVKADCYVETEIINGKEKVLAKRTRMEGDKHKDSRLYITHKGTVKEFDLRQQDISSSTEWIVNYLGLDYEAFLKQRYFAQEDIAPITRMKPTALRQFCLENLLQIEWTANALEKAKDDVSKYKALMLNVQYAREGDLRQLISRHEPLKIHRKKTREWGTIEKERQVKLEEEIQEAARMLGQAKKMNAKIDKQIATIEKKYAKEEKELQAALNAFKIDENLDGLIEEMQDTINKATREISRKQAAIEEMNKRIVRWQEKKTNAKGDIGKPCENCGTKITKKHLPFMTKELTVQIDTENKLIDQAQQEWLRLQGSLTVIEGDLQDLKNSRAKQKDIREAQTNVRIELAKLKGRKAEEIEAAKEDRIDTDLIDQEMRRLAEEQAKRSENPYVDLIAREKAEIKKLSTSMRNLKIKEAEHKETVEIAKVWVEAFSSKIQSWLLNDITPLVNRYIAGYMLELANGRITAKLHTVEKLKNGNYREKFGLQVSNMDGGDTFVSLSGGAKQRVDLAVSLALSDFQRDLSHKQLEFIVLDECTSSLDAVWEEQFLRLLKKRFANTCAYVISHKETDLNLFDRVVRVIKRNGETRLEG